MRDSDLTISYLSSKESCLAAEQLDVKMPANAPTSAALVYYGGPVLSSPELVSLFWGPFSGTEIGTMVEWLYGSARFLSGERAPIGQEQVLEQYGVSGASVGVVYHQPVLPSTLVGWPEVGAEIVRLQGQGNLP